MMTHSRHTPSLSLQGEGGGFTLLEVVVAVALLGVVLATALELLGVGLRSAKTSGDYTQAVLLARRKLDELSLQEPKVGTVGGGFPSTALRTGGGYRWTAEISPEGQDAEDLPARLFKLRVKVFWAGRGGEKALELVTLRTVIEEERLPLMVSPARGGPSPQAQQGR